MPAGRGIRLHLDGARLFVESVHTGISPARYAELFDTVYVSLYKCFNSVSGAVLGGTRAFTENLFHVRRMFGSGLPGAWPFAAVALQFVDDFLEQYTFAWRKARDLFRALARHPRVSDRAHRQRYPYRSGVRLRYADAERFRERLAGATFTCRRPAGKGGFWLRVNPSLNRMSAEDVARAFVAAL